MTEIALDLPGINLASTHEVSGYHRFTGLSAGFPARERKIFCFGHHPVVIDGESYVEGRNLTASEFYEKWVQSDELPKTRSGPSIADLEEILTILRRQKDYKFHVLGLFI